MTASVLSITEGSIQIQTIYCYKRTKFSTHTYSFIIHWSQVSNVNEVMSVPFAYKKIPKKKKKKIISQKCAITRMC